MISLTEMKYRVILDTNYFPFVLSNFFCSFCNTEIIHRIMGHDDPPFRPDLTSVEVRPEFVDLMVDCWSDDPEERPHFFRIVDRLKKISGRYNYLSIFINITYSLKLLVNLAI